MCNIVRQRKESSCLVVMNSKSWGPTQTKISLDPDVHLKQLIHRPSTFKSISIIQSNIELTRYCSANFGRAGINLTLTSISGYKSQFIYLFLSLQDLFGVLTLLGSPLLVNIYFDPIGPCSFRCASVTDNTDNVVVVFQAACNPHLLRDQAYTELPSNLCQSLEKMRFGRH
jgi:hypothetical protein